MKMLVKPGKAIIVPEDEEDIPKARIVPEDEDIPRAIPLEE